MKAKNYGRAVYQCLRVATDDKNAHSKLSICCRKRFLFVAEAIYKSQSKTGLLSVKTCDLNATSDTCEQVKKERKVNKCTYGYIEKFAESKGHILKSVTNKEVPYKGSLNLLSSDGTLYQITAKYYLSKNYAPEKATHLKRQVLNEKYEKIAEERGDTFKEYCLKGRQATLKLISKNGVPFQVSARYYVTAIYVKRYHLSKDCFPSFPGEHKNSKINPWSLEKDQRRKADKLVKQKRWIKILESKEMFVTYLEESISNHVKNNNNIYDFYNCIMLYYIINPVLQVPGEIYQIHHVVPFHAGGWDVPWNRVLLPYRVHILVHHLRFLWLKQRGDLTASLLMKKVPCLTRAERKVVQERSVQTSQQTKSGFYDPIVQARGQAGSQLFLKNKREAKLQPFFLLGMVWHHKISDSKIIIEPGSVVDLPGLINAFIEKLSKQSDLISTKNLQTLLNLLQSKCAHAHRPIIDVLLGKRQQSCFGWKVNVNK